MKSNRQSDMFKINQFFWNIFGLWHGKTYTKYYKYFSFILITSLTFLYVLLLTVSLFYAPRNIEVLIQEGIFFFTEVAVLAKVLLIIILRDEISAIFKILDCAEFHDTDDFGKKIIEQSHSAYIWGWKTFTLISHFAYVTLGFLPLILFKDFSLPFAKYYFLSDEIKEEYFTYSFVYQSVGMYVHMMYNINIDSFIAGLPWVAITQLKVLNYNYTQMKKNSGVNVSNDADLSISKLNKLLRHYDVIVKYSSDIQKVMSLFIFIQFCMASLIICLSMCGLLMVSSISILQGMISYLFAMTLQIFIPGWLGSQLAYESRELANAAYSSSWISETESYKRSLRLFMGRVNTPIVITGLKMFPLSLGTFMSIMKMAYSLFTLLRKVQDR